MDKIKNLEQVIIPEHCVLVELVKPERRIILPDGSEDEDSYGVIIVVHETIKDLKPGDIIIKYGGKLFGYTIKDPIGGKERIYCVMPRGGINIAVHPDNFVNPDILTRKVKI